MRICIITILSIGILISSIVSVIYLLKIRKRVLRILLILPCTIINIWNFLHLYEILNVFIYMITGRGYSGTIMGRMRVDSSYLIEYLLTFIVSLLMCIGIRLLSKKKDGAI